MKKIFLISLFVFSCTTNKTEPFASIDKVEYSELANANIPAVVIVNIKINDLSIIKKLENKELRGFRISSIKKEDRNYFFYEVWKVPKRKENTFSFLIFTGYFLQNISDKEKKVKRIWNKENITKALSGDVDLIFYKDSINIKASKDRKIIIQLQKA